MAKYFHHVAPTSRSVFFWRDSHAERYAGVQLHVNLNLLAAAVGDAPPVGLSLVPAASYDTRVTGIGAINVQPFVELRGTTQVELPIGPHLKNILDYPLGNHESLNLSLPFYDSTLGIGDSGGGWFRDSENDGAFHGGWDVTPKSQTSTSDLFEVCAAADGVVIGMTKRKNQPIVIQHSANGTEFLTIYQHLDLTGSSLNVNDSVTRGQFLARITDEKEVPDPASPHFRHLHFIVGIKGPAFTHSTGPIPSLWYAIDPFGVYDYYKNRTNLTTYNYLPDKSPDCFAHRIQGSSHPIQWGAQPLIKTLPVARETAYLPIVRMQMRVRKGDFRQGVPPAEVNQCMVWLQGIGDYFFVPLEASSGDTSVELKTVDFLMQCFDRKRKVKVEYYPIVGKNFISAVWAND